MPQDKLKKWLPTPEQIFENKALRMFAPHLSDVRLWHFNRRCLNKAVYIGVMCSFFPLPGQMALALIFCLWFRANVPMAVGLTWITNPVTTIPVFYGAYWVGAVCLGEPMITLHLIGKMLSALSLWLFSDGISPFITYKNDFSLSAFLLGLIISAVISSVISGIAFKYVWQYRVVNKWKKRHGYRPPHLLKKYRKKAEKQARKAEKKLNS